MLHADRMAPGTRPARSTPSRRTPAQAAATLDDRRPEALAQRQVAAAVQHSPRVVTQLQQQAQWSGGVAQPRAGDGTATALPEALRSGIESLSGLAMDGVRVHRDSARPAELGALAYAQGRDIYLAPGQEPHLPHEAWHVVQQAQGRVRPTLQMKGGTAVNDDMALEQEADRMGERALQQTGPHAPGPQRRLPDGGPGVVQRTTDDGKDYKNSEILDAIADAKTTVKKKNASENDYAKAMASYLTTNCGKATKYKTPKALEGQCKTWWNRPSELVAAVVPVARNALVNPTLDYDDEHGDLHFIPTPKPKKAAWDLDPTTALNLMRTEIRKHLTALGTHSADGENAQGWSPFYVTGVHSGPVGRYHVEGLKGAKVYPSTSYFSIQLQVKYSTNEITFHGYPDERIENLAVGCSKTKTGDKLK